MYVLVARGEFLYRSSGYGQRLQARDLAQQQLLRYSLWVLGGSQQCLSDVLAYSHLVLHIFIQGGQMCFFLFNSECYTEKCVMNNYFGIGLDAKISLDFNNKRDEHPEKCRWVFHGLTFGRKWSFLTTLCFHGCFWSQLSKSVLNNYIINLVCIIFLQGLKSWWRG